MENHLRPIGKWHGSHKREWERRERSIPVVVDISIDREFVSITWCSMDPDRAAGSMPALSVSRGVRGFPTEIRTTYDTVMSLH